MITLDTSALGKLNVSSSRESGPSIIGSPSEGSGIPKAQDGRPYARLTRMERLRLDGKSDEDGFGIGENGTSKDGEDQDEILPSDSDDELPNQGIVNPNGPVMVSDGKKREEKG